VAVTPTIVEVTANSSIIASDFLATMALVIKGKNYEYINDNLYLDHQNF
jgi:hypothetical protein